MFKLHIGEFCSHFQRLVHVTKRGREDQLATLLGQIAQNRNGACVFSHILDVDRFDLIAQFGYKRFTAFVMRPSPAIVADRAKEDKADFDFVFGESGRGESCKRCSPCAFKQRAAGNHGHQTLLLVWVRWKVGTVFQDRRAHLPPPCLGKR